MNLDDLKINDKFPVMFTTIITIFVIVLHAFPIVFMMITSNTLWIASYILILIIDTEIFRRFP